jgi:hypothetical protein
VQHATALVKAIITNMLNVNWHASMPWEVPFPRPVQTLPPWHHMGGVEGGRTLIAAHLTLHIKLHSLPSDMHLI